MNKSFNSMLKDLPEVSKKKSTLFVRVKQENKEFIDKIAHSRGISASNLVDRIIDKLRSSK